MLRIPVLTSAKPKSVLEDEARARVRAAIPVLANDAHRPSVVLERILSDRATALDFPFERIYRNIAVGAGFQVTSIVVQNRRGYEHLLLLTRDPNMGSLKESAPLVAQMI